MMQFAGYLVSAFVLLLFFGNRDQFKIRIFSNRFYKDALALSIAALIVGFYIRVLNFNMISEGRYLQEEIMATLTYISSILSGRPTLTGGTNIVFFLITAFWEYIFGPSLIANRALSAVMGIIALIFLYLAIKRLADRNSALLATALAAMSLYASCFSRIAIETGWPLTFFSVSLFLYAKIVEGKRPNLYTLILGLIVGLGMLTYPGFTLWVIAVSPFLLWQLVKTRRLSLKVGGFFILGSLPILAPALAFHLLFQSQAPFGKGGGGFSWSNLQVYPNALLAQFKDIFVEASSYYLFQKSTFVESAYWGFFAIGAWRLIFRRRSRWAIVLLGSMVLIPFISALAAGFPGMRRGIVFLFLFYIFAGAGLSAFLEFTSQRKQIAIRAFGYGVCVMALMVSGWCLIQGQLLVANLPPVDRLFEVLHQPKFNDWIRNSDLTVVIDLGPNNMPDMRYDDDWLHYKAQVFKDYAFLEDFSGRNVKNFSVLLPTNHKDTVDLDSIDQDLKNSKKRLVVMESTETLKIYETNYCVSRTVPILTSKFPLFLSEVTRCHK